MPKYHVAKGYTFKVNDKVAGSITSLGTPEVSLDTEETTSVTDATRFKTFMATLADAGEISVEGMADMEDEGQTELRTHFKSGEEIKCEIDFPAAMGLKWTFTAVQTKYKLGEATGGGGLLKFSSSLKISGEPELEELAAAEG